MLIGNTGVGKTSFLTKFTDDKYEESGISTVGVDFKTRMCTIKDKQITITMWDTAGQERFQTICRNYYRNAKGILLMFSVNDEASFQNLLDWIDAIDKFANEVPIILCGNKCDLPRSVTEEQAKQFAVARKLPYFDVSAKTGQNIEAVVYELADLILQMKPHEEDDLVTLHGGPPVDKHNDTEEKKPSGCCK